jgi:hypothetical protein
LVEKQVGLGIGIVKQRKGAKQGCNGW